MAKTIGGGTKSDSLTITGALTFLLRGPSPPSGLLAMPRYSTRPSCGEDFSSTWTEIERCVGTTSSRKCTPDGKHLWLELHMVWLAQTTGGFGETNNGLCPCLEVGEALQGKWRYIKSLDWESPCPNDARLMTFGPPSCCAQATEQDTSEINLIFSLNPTDSFLSIFIEY